MSTATDPTPPTSPTSLMPSDDARRVVGDGASWPYVLPMAVFLVLVEVGGRWDGLYVLSHVARAVLVGGLLLFVWRRVRHDVRWTHLPLGVLVGVVGFVQWVGMDKLLLLGGDWTGWMSFADPAEGRIVPQEFGSLTAVVGFLVVRFVGLAMVVPFMEELFWRNWLWRTVIAPNDFRLAGVGEYDRWAFWGVPLAFALVHVQWFIAIVWGLLVAWLLVRTKSLGACVVAHAVTNGLLGAYVLVMWYGFGVNEWYFL